MLDSHGKLAIVILVYYGIGIFVSSYVCYRQGVGRHVGWLYLISLPLVRIIGAATRIAVETESRPSIGLYITTGIMTSIGLVPLLLALMGMLKRVNDGMKTSRVTPRVFLFIHLVTVVGLSLSIAGGVEDSPGNSAMEQHNGETYRKVASIMLLISIVVNGFLAVFQVLRRRDAWEGDQLMIIMAVLSVPFLFVRVLYVLLLAFSSSQTSVFYFVAPNIYVQTFMQVFMEFIVFALYCYAGLFAATMKDGHHDRGNGFEVFGMKNHPGPGVKGEMESGSIPAGRY